MSNFTCDWSLNALVINSWAALLHSIHCVSQFINLSKLLCLSFSDGSVSDQIKSLLFIFSRDLNIRHKHKEIYGRYRNFPIKVTLDSPFPIAVKYGGYMKPSTWQSYGGYKEVLQEHGFDEGASSKRTPEGRLRQNTYWERNVEKQTQVKCSF